MLHMNESKTPIEEPKRTGLLIWLIVSQFFAICSLAFWAVSATMSLMSFDSGVTLAAWAVVIVVWSYPLFPIGMSIASWIAYKRHKNRLAAILSGMSLVPPAVFFILSMFIFSS